MRGCVGRDAVLRFRVVSRRVRGSQPVFPGSVFDVDVPALSTCVAHRRHEHTGPAICHRTFSTSPKSDDSGAAETPQSRGNNATFSSERHDAQHRGVGRARCVGRARRALETNSVTRRRVFSLQTTSVSPGAFSSSGAAEADEVARPAPRAVDVDWLFRNTRVDQTRWAAAAPTPTFAGLLARKPSRCQTLRYEGTGMPSARPPRTRAPLPSSHASSRDS